MSIVDAKSERINETHGTNASLLFLYINVSARFCLKNGRSPHISPRKS